MSLSPKLSYMLPLAACLLNLRGIGHVASVLKEKITSRKSKKPESTYNRQHFAIKSIQMF